MKKKAAAIALISIALVALALALSLSVAYFSDDIFAKTDAKIIFSDEKRTELSLQDESILNIFDIIPAKEAGTVRIASPREEIIYASTIRPEQENKKIQDRIQETRDKRITITTDIIAAETIKETTAEITLQKAGPVNMILYCPDWDQDDGCSAWQQSSIHFIENETHISFSIPHFTAYAGGWVNYSSQISSGLFNLTGIIGTNITLLNMTGTNYTSNGTYSEIIDAESQAIWDRISYGGAYQQEISNDSSTMLLMHFNNQTEYGENSTLIYDFSGRGNNGTVYGGAVWNSTGGKIGGGFQFDGNDYINMPDSDSLKFGSGDFTLSAWAFVNSFYSQGSVWNVIITKGGAELTGAYGFYLQNTGKPSFKIYNDSFTIWGNVFINNSRWHHLVATRESGNVSFYIDGTLVGKLNNSFNINNTGNLRIAADPALGIRYFNGSIDEVAIYNRSLNASEIYENYLKGARTLKYQVATSDDNSIWSSFIGPGRSASNYHDSPSQTLNISHSRYLKYRFYLETADSTITPIISNITVKYYYPTQPNGSGISNTTSLKIWDDYDYDSFTPESNVVMFFANYSNFTSGQSIVRELENDSSTILLMHFNNQSEYGENSTRVHDFSGRGNNGSVNGSIWNASAGRINGAFQFDGINDWIDLNDVALYDFHGNFSFGGWFKTGGYTSFGVCTGGRGSIIGNRDWGWHADITGTTSLRLSCTRYHNYTASYSVGGYNLSEDRWYNFMCIQNSTHLSLFVDGTNAGSTATQNITSYYHAQDRPTIGYHKCGSTDYYFNGTVDEIAIYNRSLSPDEIFQMYNSSYCQFSQNSSGSWSSPANMTYDPASKLHEYSMLMDGANSYSIYCDATNLGYDLLNATDTANITKICDQGDLQTECNITAKHSLSANNYMIFANNINIKNTGMINSSTGNTSFFLNLTGNMTVDSGGRIETRAGNNLTGGNISITAYAINISGQVLSRGGGCNGSACQAGRSGSLTLQANSVDVHGNLTTDANGIIISSDYLKAGSAGDVRINATTFTLFPQGTIRLSGGAAGASVGAYFYGGSGGMLNITADDIFIDGNITAKGNWAWAYGPSNTHHTYGGPGGRIFLTAAQNISVNGKIDLSGGNGLHTWYSYVYAGIGGNITIRSTYLNLNSTIIAAGGDAYNTDITSNWNGNYRYGGAGGSIMINSTEIRMYSAAKTNTSGGRAYAASGCPSSGCVCSSPCTGGNGGSTNITGMLYNRGQAYSEKGIGIVTNGTAGTIRIGEYECGDDIGIYNPAASFFWLNCTTYNSCNEVPEGFGILAYTENMTCKNMEYNPGSINVTANTWLNLSNVTFRMYSEKQTTLVCNISNSYISRSSFDFTSEYCRIENSTIYRSNLIDTNPINAWINSSNFTRSTIENMTGCANMNGYLATIKDDMIFSGTISRNGYTYYSPSTTTEMCAGTAPSTGTGTLTANKTIVRNNETIKLAYAGSAGATVTLNISLLDSNTISYSLSDADYDGVYDESYVSDAWLDKDPSSSPSSRYGHGFSYDSKSSLFVLFGGYNLTALSDTWAYNYSSNAWTNMAPSSFPSARWSHRMVFDPDNNVSILFGGWSGSAVLNDTWIYDSASNIWMNKNPSGLSIGKYFPGMAYSTSAKVMVMYGGYNGTAYVNETWMYNYTSNSWMQKITSQAPPGRHSPSFIYHPRSDTFILFGGYIGPGLNMSSETWMYNLSANTWTNITPQASPEARYHAAAAYSSDQDYMLLFGGYNGIGMDDTWTYYPSSNTWSENQEAGNMLARYVAWMGYDEQNDLFLLFGGYNVTAFFNETRAYPATPLKERVRISRKNTFSDGIKQVSAKINDNLGNTFYSYLNITLDNTAPTASIDVIGGNTTTTSIVSLQLNYSDANGIKECAYQNNQSDFTYALFEACTQTKDWLVPLGQSRIFYAVVDNAGNIRITNMTVVYTVSSGDATPPSTPLVYDGLENEDADYFSTNTSLSAHWTSVDYDSRQITYRYRILKDGNNITGYADVGAKTEVKHENISLLPNSNYSFQIQARNPYNYTSTGYSDGSILDMAAPNITSSVSSTHPFDNESYANTTAIFSWNATDDIFLKGYSYSLDTNPQTIPDDFLELNISSYVRITLQPGPEGIDSYVRINDDWDGYSNNINHGNETWLEFRQYNANSYDRRVYLKFTALPPFSVRNANLNLYLGSNPQSLTRTIPVRKVLADWNESTITAATQPLNSSTTYASTVVSGTGWKIWNVTSLVNDWIANGSNYGLVMNMVESGSWFSFNIYSSDQPSASVRPKLDFSYDLPNTAGNATYTGLTSGTYYFHLKAIDGAGNYNVIHRKIIISSDGLSVSLDQPRYETSEQAINITGTVGANATLLFYINSINQANLTANGTFNAELSLSNGTNSIYALATTGTITTISNTITIKRTQAQFANLSFTLSFSSAGSATSRMAYTDRGQYVFGLASESATSNPSAGPLLISTNTSTPALIFMSQSDADVSQRNEELEDAEFLDSPNPSIRGAVKKNSAGFLLVPKKFWLAGNSSAGLGRYELYIENMGKENGKTRLKIEIR